MMGRSLVSPRISARTGSFSIGTLASLNRSAEISLFFLSLLRDRRIDDGGAKAILSQCSPSARLCWKYICAA